MPKFNRIGKEKSLSHCLAMVAVKRWCQNALKICKKKLLKVPFLGSNKFGVVGREEAFKLKDFSGGGIHPKHPPTFNFLCNHKGQNFVEIVATLFSFSFGYQTNKQTDKQTNR
jgi:hypothetical protein